MDLKQGDRIRVNGSVECDGVFFDVDTMGTVEKQLEGAPKGMLMVTLDEVHNDTAVTLFVDEDNCYPLFEQGARIEVSGPVEYGGTDYRVSSEATVEDPRPNKKGQILVTLDEIDGDGHVGVFVDMDICSKQSMDRILSDFIEKLTVGYSFRAKKTYPFGARSGSELSPDITCGERITVLKVINGTKIIIGPLEAPDAWIEVTPKELYEIKKGKEPA